MVFYFIIVGAFLERSGAGKLFVDIAQCFTARAWGGSGKAAVVASGLFGLISGSAVANVLISGVMTRLAVVGVSVGIMIWGSNLAQYEDLAPLLIVMSGLAVIVGLGLGVRYRSALLDVLTDDRSRLAKVLPDWARFEAVRIVTQ